MWWVLGGGDSDGGMEDEMGRSYDYLYDIFGRVVRKVERSSLALAYSKIHLKGSS